MVVKAAPWAPWIVDALLRAREEGIVLLLAIGGVPLFLVDSWLVFVWVALSVLAYLSLGPIRKRSDVWPWAESEHSELPYWYALKLFRTPFRDFAIVCVAQCSRASMENNFQDRQEWQHRLYRVYMVHGFPHDPSSNLTAAEMRTFLELYDS